MGERSVSVVLRPPVAPGFERFAAGDQFTFNGVRFRIVHGTKRPGDLRIEWLGDGGFWVPLSFEPVAFLVDFFFENEDRLYPRPTYQGGDYFMAFLRSSVRHGYRHAWGQVLAEKEQMQQQLDLTEVMR